jgi:pantoate--beta-alanine ligase
MSMSQQRSDQSKAPPGQGGAMTLQVVREKSGLREITRAWRLQGLKIGVVPTMGALHRGHLTLLERARRTCDRVIVTIFVNPTQFGPNEDFAAYPRDEAGDLEKLRDAGADLVWMPGVEAMYPPGYATEVSVKGLADGLCGEFRPGHFVGVATVVTKLLLQTAADQAFFGEKDYQQLQVIRRVVVDLDIPTEIVGVETVREADGLALSSRNAYLGAHEREIAASLPKVLREIAETAAGPSVNLAAMLDAACAGLISTGFNSVDYLRVCDAESLRPLDTVTGPARVLVAARIGRTRLIDNMPVMPHTGVAPGLR